MTKIELPIPKHLKNILIPLGERNNKNHVDGVIRCECGSETFKVNIYSEKNKDYVCVGEYEEDYGLVVMCNCVFCNRKHLVFDMSKHGWNGFVCKDGVTIPEEKLFDWKCKECGSSVYHMTISISSEGKEDFVENLTDEIGEGEFKEEDWIESFSWITINIVCYDCGFENTRWIDYETM